MGHPNIALIGRARSGKDTIAARLISRYAYTRIAFADPLKEMSLSLDPIVAYEPSGYGPLPTRLSAVVQRYGWEKAKDRFPEVRRTLQRAGQAVRDQEPGHWLSLALDKVTVADTWNLPVVVTDCRYPNEAEALKARGFRLVRVLRPHAGQAAPAHESETALDGYPTDVTVANVGTLSDLNALADALV
ncbi:deoxynucleotide monophosphate kinase family protein [Streptomyces violascens]|uniref:Deoxynucleoside monophosphate kinase n=1 Tax=Streptomyces violascens TaxID=67381 RepID=A0ABQ3QQV3_9ACTN|nr:hypothetical protein [Streptomyces violascens]GGU49123.1 hypothetical protein GCM10010289_82090 [Streptomyces violascens]GHI39635.1 hypothetical protein Sviol_40430 [Streptomyces violascens]